MFQVLASFVFVLFWCLHVLGGLGLLGLGFEFQDYFQGLSSGLKFWSLVLISQFDIKFQDFKFWNFKFVVSNLEVERLGYIVWDANQKA
jgi:hypothetical protein